MYVMLIIMKMKTFNDIIEDDDDLQLLIDDNVDYHVYHDDGYVNDSDDDDNNDDNDDDNHIKCFSKFKGSRSVLIPYTFIYIWTCQIFIPSILCHFG